MVAERQLPGVGLADEPFGPHIIMPLEGDVSEKAAPIGLETGRIGECCTEGADASQTRFGQTRRPVDVAADQGLVGEVAQRLEGPLGITELVGKDEALRTPARASRVVGLDQQTSPSQPRNWWGISLPR